MEKNSFKKIIAIVLFMLAIVGPTIAWFSISYISKKDPTIIQNIDFDLGEKRKKATLSEILSVDNITSELEKVYNDRIPFRSYLISFKTYLDAMIEKPYRDVENAILCFLSGKNPRDIRMLAEEVDGVIRYYMDDAVDIYYNHGLTIKEFDPYNPYIEYPVKYSENNNVIIGQSNWLFLNKANVDLYTGKLSITENGIKEYVNLLDGLNAKCNLIGKKLVILICPEKEEIYPEYMPHMEIVDSKERTIKIRDYIASNSNIKYVYPKEELIKAKGKYLVYRKYDSHWNYVGGYLAAKKVMDTLGMTTIPLRDIQIVKVDMLDNELVMFGGLDDSTFPKTFEYQVFYKPEIKAEQFSVPGMNNKVSIRAESSTENKEKLFLIGDSFSHALVQFLYKDFKEFYLNSFSDVFDGLVDENYLKEELKKSDVILVEVVERNEPTVMKAICYKLASLLQELYG